MADAEPRRILRVVEAFEAQPPGPPDMRLCTAAAKLLDAAGVGVSLRANDDTWPTFANAAAALGFRAVFAFPLRSGSISLGSLTLYQYVAGDLTAEQYGDALVVARFALGLLTSLQAGRPADELDEVFANTLSISVEVHQASGVVAVQLGVPVAAASAVGHLAIHDLLQPGEGLRGVELTDGDEVAEQPRAGEVAQPRQDPEAQDPSPPAPIVQQGGRQHHVGFGEQDGLGQHHEEEPDAEREPSDRLAGAGGFDPLAEQDR